jgi:hypothetical protein
MLNTPRNNNKKYVPPTTEKKELKKEFSLQPEAFPTLSGTTSKPLLSFAQAAQKTPVKTATNNTAVLLPGWLYIRRAKGMIEYKSGPPSQKAASEAEASEAEAREAEAENRLGRLLVKYRLAKEQYTRDNDVMRLGDLSEYYNTPTLQEQFAEEDIAMLKTDYVSSDSSDAEHF